jgi:hypothetical protein
MIVKTIMTPLYRAILIGCLSVWLSGFIQANNSKGHHNSAYMSDFMAMPLSKMIGTAELVVLGEIESVSESTCSFVIYKTLKGTSGKKLIQVIKVRPDPFASIKPPPYKKGQRYLLFMDHFTDIKETKAWHVMGTGGEGQMPADSSFVYFRGNNIKGLKFENYAVHGKDEYVQRFDLASMLDALQGYDKCFRWKGQDKSLKPEIQCSDTKIKEYSSKGFLHNYLTVQTKSLIK